MDFDQVISIVREAKNIIFDEKLLANVKLKGFADYVTEVDFSVQKYIEEHLRELDPTIQFWGEEESAEVDLQKPLWILDPVDGTTNMLHHMGYSAVSLALMENGCPVFSVIYNPFSDELFTAKENQGAFLNGEAISVSSRDTLDGSLIAVGTCPYNKSLASYNFPLFQTIFEKCADVRHIGSAAMDCAFVAAGRTDGYMERELKVWDMAAGILLVKEAGGIVTAFDGEDLDFSKNKGMLAAAPKIHPILLAEIKKTL